MKTRLLIMLLVLKGAVSLAGDFRKVDEQAILGRLMKVEENICANFTKQNYDLNETFSKARDVAEICANFPKKVENIDLASIGSAQSLGESVARLEISLRFKQEKPDQVRLMFNEQGELNQVISDMFQFAYTYGL